MCIAQQQISVGTVGKNTRRIFDLWSELYINKWSVYYFLSGRTHIKRKLGWNGKCSKLLKIRYKQKLLYTWRKKRGLEELVSIRNETRGSPPPPRGDAWRPLYVTTKLSKRRIGMFSADDTLLPSQNNDLSICVLTFDRVLHLAVTTYHEHMRNKFRN